MACKHAYSACREHPSCKKCYKCGKHAPVKKLVKTDTAKSPRERLI